MNQENFDYLKNQVKFTGFGEAHEDALRSNMEKQPEDFKLTHAQKFGNNETEATLNFRKSEQGMYFFNSYNLSMKEAGEKEPVQQTFYVGKDNTFTLKEAYNMLDGRSVNKDLVNKEGQAYNAWVKLDFKDTDNNGNFKLKHYTENYGYDLKAALEKLPIKELAVPEDREKLMNSLEKGNRQSATFLNDGKEEKRFVEANPQYKTVTVYDGSMKRIRNDQKEGETNSQSESKANKKTEKQDNDEEGGKKENKKKKRSQHI
jgi:hypothetical protein